MPSSTTYTPFTVLRLAIVGVGFGVAALTALELATMPPPPPDSDGFAHGMAAIVGSVIIVSSLGLATISVVFPALLGRADPLGFDRWQRLALKGAGVMIGGGFVLGIAYGYATIPPFGVVLWLGFVVLAAVVVCVTLVWRLAQALASRLAGVGVGGT